MLENDYTGAGFVTPHFKTEKGFHIGKEYSIFTAELCAILMELLYLVDTMYVFVYLILRGL